MSVDTIEFLRTGKLAANDLTLDKSDIIAVIVQHGMYPLKQFSEDILSHSNVLSERQVLKLFYHNLCVFLTINGFVARLADNSEGVLCQTNKGMQLLNLEFIKEEKYKYIINIDLKIGACVFARLEQGEVIEVDEITPEREIYEINKKTFAIISSEDQLVATAYFNSYFTSLGKGDLKKILGYKHGEEINFYGNIDIDYTLLKSLIGSSEAAITINFIKKYGKVSFLKIMKELLDE